jgi:DNA-binding LytR/AlgR family response regulator
MREYVYIHLAESKVITKMGIGEMEKLISHHFLRVHRSFLVNINKLTAYTAEDIFINKIPIPIGTNYKKMVESFLTTNVLKP